MSTAEEIAAALPRLSDRQVERIAALLAIAIDTSWSTGLRSAPVGLRVERRNEGPR